MSQNKVTGVILKNVSQADKKTNAANGSEFPLPYSIFHIPYSQHRILFITGPTASGKSDLAMRIAEEFDGEIICADSQTVRRGMDIGTAKPTKEDQRKVPHHVLDVIDPYEHFTVADFTSRAEAAISDIQNRGKLPIVVGGTGLYIDALLYGFSFRPTVGDYTREVLEAKSVSELQAIITQAEYPMPENENNPRHLIRVIETKGMAPKKNNTRESAVIVAIDPGKIEHAVRVERRVDAMFDSGLISEIEQLLEQFGSPPKNFDAIVYRLAWEQLNELGKMDKQLLRERFIIGDRQYAKKQRAWMKRNKDIQWFSDPEEAYHYLVSSEQ